MTKTKKKVLLLSSYQSLEANDFYNKVQGDRGLYDYSGYTDILFLFDNSLKHRASFLNLDTGKKSWEYGGAYIHRLYNNGVLKYPDLAFAAARVLDYERIRVIDSELIHAPSLTKVSETARLAIAGISIPRTYAGTKIAIIRAITTNAIKLPFPLVFKDAAGSRGDDNIIVYNENEVFDYLQEKDDTSLWIAQALIPNKGFWRLNTFYGKAGYAIFRSLEGMPEDRDPHKKHFYKPPNGTNASYLKPSQIPRDIALLAKNCTKVLGREIAGVDIVVNSHTNKPYVIEANNSPQFITVNSIKETRIKEFLKAIEKLQ